jgi:hypothetical protein
LLDQESNPVPVGLMGELYISGVGLARGYINRSGITAEKFLPDPFSETPGSRMFKTSDLGRYLLDGRIDFLGRSDYQVKLRGYRIELGEIESLLRRHKAVQDAVVIEAESAPGEKQLVAYLTRASQSATYTDGHDESDSGHRAISTSEVRAYLHEHLPPYMAPSTFVWLEAMPLTRSGKIDRRALPEPGHARPELVEAYIAPQGALEKKISVIWEEILQVERVGIKDNFFDLGGHSLLLIQAQRKLELELERKLSIVELFRYPTIQLLADHLSQEDHNESVLVEAQRQAARRKEALQRRRRKDGSPVSVGHE